MFQGRPRGFSGFHERSRRVPGTVGECQMISGDFIRVPKSSNDVPWGFIGIPKVLKGIPDVPTTF